MRTSATTAAAPPDHGPRAARGGAPPGDAFALLLESTTKARTATAEGPTTDTPRPTSAADRDTDPGRPDRAAADAAAQAASAQPATDAAQPQAAAPAAQPQVPADA
ncbi:MAG TPA: hypothetical protein VN238_14535, partial [Solirubrobacteraceae bacterium]|nr:hypothetical protein [Solirubrobacteraceae bacterium]